MDVTSVLSFLQNDVNITVSRKSGSKDYISSTLMPSVDEKKDYSISTDAHDENSLVNNMIETESILYDSSSEFTLPYSVDHASWASTTKVSTTTDPVERLTLSGITAIAQATQATHTTTDAPNTNYISDNNVATAIISKRLDLNDAGNDSSLSAVDLTSTISSTVHPVFSSVTELNEGDIETSTVKSIQEALSSDITTYVPSSVGKDYIGTLPYQNKATVPFPTSNILWNLTSWSSSQPNFSYISTVLPSSTGDNTIVKKLRSYESPTMTSIIPSSLVSNPVCEGRYNLEFVDDLQLTVYNIVFPILICLGIIANVVCIVVLTKPKMRSVHVNKYFLALAISDLMVCVMNIPIASTTNGCTIYSYSSAFYFAHFGWSLIDVWQTLSFYTILSLSYDRFLAVWFYQRFKREQTNTVLRNRVIFVVILDIAVQLFFFFNVEIDCLKTDNMGNCENDSYIIKDSYHKHSGAVWHTILLVIRESVVRWIPGALLVIFNVGLVMAICSGRLHNPASSLRNKKRKEFRVTTTSIVITISFLLCTFPNAVFVVWFSANIQKKCYGCYEDYRGAANILQLVEHVIHIAFLVVLNPSFRSELVNLLLCRATSDLPSEDDQSSRNLQLYQINRRSGTSPFPSRSYDSCVNNTKNANNVNNGGIAKSGFLAPPDRRY